MISMSQSILYYPSIDIKDGPWLRGAALYWDQVRSIVPYKEYSNFSPEILYMEARGHYKPLYPEDVFVLGHPDHFQQLARKYLIKTSPSRACTPIRTDNSQTYRFQDNSFTSFFHFKKIPSEFMESLIKQRNVRIQGEWIEASESFVFQYMKLLADYAINHLREDIVLGSDAKKKFNDIYPNSGKQPTGFEVSLQHCLPIPRPDIGFEDILNFKEQRHYELLAMQRKLRDFEDELRHSENPLDLKSSIARFRDSWEHSVRDFEKMAADSKLDTFFGNLCTFVNGGEVAEYLYHMTTGTSEMPPVIAATALTGAGLIALRKGYRNSMQNRYRRENEDFAYILSAKQGGIIQINNETEWL